MTQTLPMMMTDIYHTRSVYIVSLGESNGEMVLSDLLLSDKIWVRFVVDLLDHENLNVMTMITEQQKYKILRDSFQQHLINCIKDKHQSTHWSMHFA